MIGGVQPNPLRASVGSTEASDGRLGAARVGHIDRCIERDVEPVSGRIYTSAEHGCRMTAPGNDWSIEEVKEPGAMVLRFRVPEKGKGDVQLHFVCFSLPVPLEPKALLTIRRKYYEKNPQRIQGRR